MTEISNTFYFADNRPHTVSIRGEITDVTRLEPKFLAEDYVYYKIIKDIPCLADSSNVTAFVSNVPAEFINDDYTVKLISLPIATTIGEGAFRACFALTTVNLPVATTIKERAFSFCNSLITVNLPMATTIGANAFYHCDSLIAIDLPVATTIEKEAFCNCNSLITANLPMATTIGKAAFDWCQSLIAIDLPAVTTIEENAFHNCSFLATADLLMATTIGVRAFSMCWNLTALVLRAETVVTLSNANALVDTAIEDGAGYIYVPSALVDSYKAATNWSTYATQFRALEDYTVDGTITGALDETKINATV